MNNLKIIFILIFALSLVGCRLHNGYNLALDAGVVEHNLRSFVYVETSRHDFDGCAHLSSGREEISRGKLLCIC